MAMFSNGYIKLATVDLSAFCKSFTAPQRVAMLDDTAMGDTTSSQEPGLKDWTITAEFLTPFASSGPDATLAPLVGSTSALAIELRAVNTTVSATNPKWTGSGVIESYELPFGKVGDQQVLKVTIRPGGATPDLTRATS